ncbi:MAG: hypothetical protein WKF84_10935 [Pyrinomonadaceae bacterium]
MQLRLCVSKETGTPFFSSSSLRYVPELRAVKTNNSLGTLLGAFAYGPAPLEPHHPDLYWYGIHTVETLYMLMGGAGCESVSRSYTAGADTVVGRWKDGRIGTMRGAYAKVRSLMAQWPSDQRVWSL